MEQVWAGRSATLRRRPATSIAYPSAPALADLSLRLDGTACSTLRRGLAQRSGRPASSRIRRTGLAGTQIDPRRSGCHRQGRRNGAIILPNDQSIRSSRLALRMPTSAHRCALREHYAHDDESMTAQDPEDSLDEESQETIPELEPLTYFGTDFDVHGLVRRLNTNDIIVPRFDPVIDSVSDVAGFQRKFVWKKTQMDRFIESLLLGFPIPGIFLVQQADKSLLVLDGQQRLTTLQRFYAGQLDVDKSFVLENVAEDYKGLAYETLDEEQRRTLDNTFIHATVVKYNPALGGAESVYSLFERLNTGGTNLYPQEIRVALYNGRLVELLRELNSNADWRVIYGPPSERLKDQELILRFLAFYEDEESYERPLKVFLNEFLSGHRELQGLDATNLKDIFQRTSALASQVFGRSALRPDVQVNAAFADAIMVGLARRLASGPVTDTDALKAAREALLADGDFISAIARATADEDRVSRRLTLAKDAFRAVK